MKTFSTTLALLAITAQAFKEQRLEDMVLKSDTTNSTPSTGAADGIWTDHDWNNGEVGVTNGLPFGVSTDTARKIQSPQVYLGQMASTYSDQANAILVGGIFTEDIFKAQFPLHKSTYTYKSFLQAVAKFPKFCNEVPEGSAQTLDEMCKMELAALLAHIKYETASMLNVSQSGCNVSTEVKTSCDYFDETGETALIWDPYSGKQYYGRGALMMQWNYNYGRFSDIAYSGGQFDKMDLLENPGDVATDGYLAFASAVWEYMTPVSPMPSMHEAMTGFFVPNDWDTTNGIGDGFGTTINIISSGTECNTGTGAESSAATARISYYTQFCGVFGCSTSGNFGCMDQAKFTDESSSYYPDQFFEKNTEKENECQTTNILTGYSLYSTRDYMRCVCDFWGQDVDDCLTPVEDTTTTGAYHLTTSVTTTVLAMFALMTQV